MLLAYGSLLVPLTLIIDKKKWFLYLNRTSIKIHKVFNNTIKTPQTNH